MSPKGLYCKVWFSAFDHWRCRDYKPSLAVIRIQLSFDKHLKCFTCKVLRHGYGIARGTSFSFIMNQTSRLARFGGYREDFSGIGLLLQQSNNSSDTERPEKRFKVRTMSSASPSRMPPSFSQLGAVINADIAREFTDKSPYLVTNNFRPAILKLGGDCLYECQGFGPCKPLFRPLRLKDAGHG
nr:hypothetical protein Iba_chr12eCG12290 [Ipomoea batatas]